MEAFKYKIFNQPESILHNQPVKIIKQSRHVDPKARVYTVEVISGPHKGCIEKAVYAELKPYLVLVA